MKYSLSRLKNQEMIPERRNTNDKDQQTGQVEEKLRVQVSKGR